jgi:hypothetical protein
MSADAPAETRVASCRVRVITRTVQGAPGALSAPRAPGTPGAPA